MKIVVIGGSGLIGKKLVRTLQAAGHTVIPASPSTGINAVTGEGLQAALSGAQVVVDVSNSPSWEDRAVLEFFEKSTRNLLAAEASAGVRHHVALSVVGADRLPESGYMRAKVAQENLIQASSVPYTILRATQFFEFVGGIAEAAAVDGVIRLPPAMMQPIFTDDIVVELAEIAVAEPKNGMVEVAGPDSIRQDELVRQFLRATNDSRKVTTDPQARYYGTLLDDRSLTPGAHPRLGPTHFADWLGRTPVAAGSH